MYLFKITLFDDLASTFTTKPRPRVFSTGVVKMPDAYRHWQKLCRLELDQAIAHLKNASIPLPLDKAAIDILYFGIARNKDSDNADGAILDTLQGDYLDRSLKHLEDDEKHGFIRQDNFKVLIPRKRDYYTFGNRIEVTLEALTDLGDRLTMLVDVIRAYFPQASFDLEALQYRLQVERGKIPFKGGRKEGCLSTWAKTDKLREGLQVLVEKSILEEAPEKVFRLKAKKTWVLETQFESKSLLVEAFTQH